MRWDVQAGYMMLNEKIINRTVVTFPILNFFMVLKISFTQKVLCGFLQIVIRKLKQEVTQKFGFNQRIWAGLRC